jgi:hypothetical protein
LIEPLFYQYNPRFKGAGTVFSPHTAIMSLSKGDIAIDNYEVKEQQYS